MPRSGATNAGPRRIAWLGAVALSFAGCLFDSCADAEEDDPGAGTDTDGEDELPFSTPVACETSSIYDDGVTEQRGWHCMATVAGACGSSDTQVPYPDETCPEVGYPNECSDNYFISVSDCTFGPKPRADMPGGGGAGEDGSVDGDGPGDGGGGGVAGKCSATASVDGSVTNQIEFSEHCLWSVQDWEAAPGDRILVIQMASPEGEKDAAGGTPQDVLVIVADDVEGRDTLVGDYTLGWDTSRADGESFAFFQEIDILGGHSTHLDPSLEGQDRGTVIISSEDGVLSGTFDLTVRFFGGTDVRFQGEFNAAEASNLFEPAVR